MTNRELCDLIKNGESSTLEFKRDDLEAHALAKGLVAFLNLQGGMLLLGVDDDGSIRGANRSDLEEWVVELCRSKIEPPIIPILAWVKDAAPGKNILMVRVPIGPDKPYAQIHNSRKTYFIRVGKTSREASRDELERLFQTSGRVQYGFKPVPGTSLADLDSRRFRDYFSRLLQAHAPSEEDAAEWITRLKNMEFLTQAEGLVATAVDGMLLFGKNPKKFLPQSGIRALAYQGDHSDYSAQADQELTGPLVPLCSQDGAIVELGLVEKALDFVRRNITPTSHLEGGRRIDRQAYPEAVLREIIVNTVCTQ